MNTAAGPLALRRADEGDCRLVFDWANDGLTRAMSFSGDPIPWERHRRWFAARLGDERSLLLMVTQGGTEPIGVVRFERTGSNEAVVSITLAPARRGRGLCAPALRLACERARERWPGLLVHAYVRPENTASLRAFARIGFEPRQDCVRNGQPSRHLVSPA